LPVRQLKETILLASLSVHRLKETILLASLPMRFAAPGL
jgi:hypothetical protein